MTSAVQTSLAALAALAAAGSASAQSRVTVFGVLDAGVSYYQTNSKDRVGTQPNLRQSQWALSTGNYAGSRLGFSGTEDLGGGLAVGFWLEAGLANDTGSAISPVALFNRRSTVSLTSRFGELRLGRDYTPTFWNDTVFDPFGTVGVGASAISMLLGGSGSPGTINALLVNPNYVRAGNAVSYFLPAGLGGLYGQVMYAFGENTKYDPGTSTPPNALNTARTGRYAGGRLGWANGPVDVGAAYGSSTVGDNYYAGSTKYLNTSNVAGSYDFGPVKLFGEYSYVQLKNDYVSTPQPTGDARVKGYLLGASVPVGVGLIRVAYSHLQANVDQAAANTSGQDLPEPKADKFSLGYVHNLSKRTALYASFAYTKNKNGAALPPALPPNGSVGYASPTLADLNQTGYRADMGYGYDFGIRHSF
ncbi:porin [Variovorax sp. OV329]|uniref:porin n=1 Tax=Variovorax sp. OV329 TaxID=1882825 RepID=UPI0008F2538F|nr:porin [Variovorax sp. OV329]SFM20715.1 Outer membrane protein (porin) [Variovorax sp. OV329]